MRDDLKRILENLNEIKHDSKIWNLSKDFRIMNTLKGMSKILIDQTLQYTKNINDALTDSQHLKLYVQNTLLVVEQIGSQKCVMNDAKEFQRNDQIIEKPYEKKEQIDEKFNTEILRKNLTHLNDFFLVTDVKSTNLLDPSLKLDTLVHHNSVFCGHNIPSPIGSNDFLKKAKNMHNDSVHLIPQKSPYSHSDLNDASQNPPVTTIQTPIEIHPQHGHEICGDFPRHLEDNFLGLSQQNSPTSIQLKKEIFLMPEENRFKSIFDDDSDQEFDISVNAPLSTSKTKPVSNIIDKPPSTEKHENIKTDKSCIATSHFSADIRNKVSLDLAKEQNKLNRIQSPGEKSPIINSKNIITDFNRNSSYPSSKDNRPTKGIDQIQLLQNVIETKSEKQRPEKDILLNKIYPSKSIFDSEDDDVFITEICDQSDNKTHISTKTNHNEIVASPITDILSNNKVGPSFISQKYDLDKNTVFEKPKMATHTSINKVQNKTSLRRAKTIFDSDSSEDDIFTSLNLSLKEEDTKTYITTQNTSQIDKNITKKYPTPDDQLE